MSKPWSGLPAPVKLTVGRSHKATQKNLTLCAPVWGCWRLANILAPGKYVSRTHLELPTPFKLTVGQSNRNTGKIYIIVNFFGFYFLCALLGLLVPGKQARANEMRC